MKNLWDEQQASKCVSDLDWRVYTSRLLGQNMNLVMHGGGNTSVKSKVDGEAILYVKGSGWDLETIEPAGFAPVKLDALLNMATLDEMSDMDMVAQQRDAMIEPTAPNPSVEAILHAVIPFKYVDHTHADALVTLSNTPHGDDLLKALYGDSVIFIPYVMPGFELAKAVYEHTKHIDWQKEGQKIKGMVLMHHGLFSFADDAKTAYDNMIELANLAEQALLSQTDLPQPEEAKTASLSDDYLTKLVEVIAQVKYPQAPQSMVALVNQSPIAQAFAQNETALSQVSVLTPDHIIRTKQKPAILSGDMTKIQAELDTYVQQYQAYFDQYHTDEICLNPAPNYVVIKGVGSVALGQSEKEVQIIQDINNHTFEAILQAQDLGGYAPLSDAELFEMEYWTLEQAKLKK